MKQMIVLAGMIFINSFILIEVESAPKSCEETPENRQFDFWIGEWTVQSNGKPAGDSSVQKILNGCVIFENWTGHSGYIGKSFNVYNRGLGKWQQFWVDGTGAVLELRGEYSNDQMRFTGQTPQADGSSIEERLTFFRLPDDCVRQLWEQSRDRGKTWSVAFDGLYRKKKR